MCHKSKHIKIPTNVLCWDLTLLWKGKKPHGDPPHHTNPSNQESPPWWGEPAWRISGKRVRRVQLKEHLEPESVNKEVRENCSYHLAQDPGTLGGPLCLTCPVAQKSSWRI